MSMIRGLHMERMGHWELGTKSRIVDVHCEVFFDKETPNVCNWAVCAGL